MGREAAPNRKGSHGGERDRAGGSPGSPLESSQILGPRAAAAGLGGVGGPQCGLGRSFCCGVGRLGATGQGGGDRCCGPQRKCFSSQGLSRTGFDSPHRTPSRMGWARFGKSFLGITRPVGGGLEELGQQFVT